MGTITEKLLEYLQLQAENTVDLLGIMMTDRRTAMRKARHSIVHGPPQFKHDWADLYRERQKFYSLLNHLKRDGLVVKYKDGRTSTWKITDEGKEYLVRLKDGQILPKRAYAKKKSISMVIVSFDVPERERRKRDWLRLNLVALGFTMLQHSVWIGKVALPHDFIKDLRSQNMLSYIHIFSVGRAGTIVKKF